MSERVRRMPGVLEIGVGEWIVALYWPVSLRCLFDVTAVLSLRWGYLDVGFNLFGFGLEVER